MQIVLVIAWLRNFSLKLPVAPQELEFSALVEVYVFLYHTNKF